MAALVRWGAHGCWSWKRQLGHLMPS